MFVGITISAASQTRGVVTSVMIDVIVLVEESKVLDVVRAREPTRVL